MKLFDDPPYEGQPPIAIASGAFLLHGFALAAQDALLNALSVVTAAAPFRYMVTPGGFEMSIAMTNTGEFGWISDRRGYRYGPIDPATSKPWPPMPPPFLEVAINAAEAVGFGPFVPDACLINRYEPGARLSLHQDRNERSFTHPIVSVSLGIPATFLLGGPKRRDKTVKIPVVHGDVLVWGGPARLLYHGILPLKSGEHAIVGRQRINLTFGKAR